MTPFFSLGLVSLWVCFGICSSVSSTFYSNFKVLFYAFHDMKLLVKCLCTMPLPFLYLLSIPHMDSLLVCFLILQCDLTFSGALLVTRTMVVLLQHDRFCI